MKTLEGFEHRAIVLPEQSLRYMEPIVGIDADGRRRRHDGSSMFDLALPVDASANLVQRVLMPAKVRITIWVRNGGSDFKSSRYFPLEDR
jgi:hypothetical protein